ncbi:MAG: TonB-dependent receptor plug domain-containing protein, partial [Flexibacteraceae bacterium]
MSDPLAKLSIVDTPVMQESVLIKVTKKVNTVEGANNTIITSGKKTDYLDLQKQPANLVTNNTRQVFGQVAGINIWENDGSGLQSNVATRGLSPNRSWEFNVRQNGVDISSEIFGYPEAYYQPTFEAVDHIEIVRGAAGLQFGPQFGGLLNYVLKEAPKNKKFDYQGNFTGGTYGLLGTYQQIGGKVGKLSYFGYGQYRRADGWRQNSEYQTSNFYGRLDYSIHFKTKVWADYTRSSYV